MVYLTKISRVLVYKLLETLVVKGKGFQIRLSTCVYLQYNETSVTKYYLPLYVMHSDI